jgi:hypothetical protein
MAQRVAVVLALVLTACAAQPSPDTPDDTSSLLSPGTTPQTGTLACNEACTSSTQCGSWCPICGTGQPGSLNGRCQHGLPLVEGWHELQDAAEALRLPDPSTVCDYAFCWSDAQCVAECSGPAKCSPRSCDNCSGQCVRLSGTP